MRLLAVKFLDAASRDPLHRVRLIVRALALCICFSVFASGLHAQSRETEESRLRTFADSVGEFLYSLAWPTATYRTVTLGGVVNHSNGSDIKLTLYGQSAFDGESLWTELILEIRNGSVSDIRWGRNNAILARPGETMTAVGQALVELSREYSRNSDRQLTPASPSAPAISSPPRAATPAPTPEVRTQFASICVTNPTNQAVILSMSWSGKEDTYTLQPNQSRMYWTGDAQATFSVKFDNSYAAGYTPTTVVVKGSIRLAEPKNCSDTEVYNFQVSGDRIGISPAEWRAGFPHPFVANVVAGAGRGNWNCAYGHKWIDPSDANNLECIANTVGLIGLTFSTNTGAPYPYIESVRQDGPANRARVPAGVWLLVVGSASMENKSTSDAVLALRGAVGTTVTIGIAPPGGTIQYFTIRRE